MDANSRVKSFIDRILRLKEEQDALAADIREVYAEAKGEGYDKTAMGEVVSHLRKVEKKGKDAVDERGALFDLYLTAYENPTGTDRATHTHAPDARQSYADQKGRESTAPTPSISKAFSAETAELGTASFDPETGEIIDTNSDATAPEPEATGLSPRATNLHSDAAPPPAASEQPETPISSPVVSGALSEPFEPPAFLKGDKAGCLKLRDGQCRLRFPTDALCSECRQAELRAKVAA